MIEKQTKVSGAIECNSLWILGSFYRASWAKYEDRKTNKMQQLDVYY